MFVTDGRSNYDKVCEELLAIVQKEGAFAKAPLLLGSVEGKAARIPLFGRDSLVLPDGVYMDGRKVDTIGSILVVRYLLRAGTQAMGHTWLPYRDLPDGAQFSSYIKANIEDRIARTFAGRAADLRSRLTELGAKEGSNDVRSDIALLVHPLPKVPVLCLFWDGDEEFPASFQFLFDSSAPSYLDLESLAAVLEYICLKVIGEG